MCQQLHHKHSPGRETKLSWRIIYQCMYNSGSSSGNNTTFRFEAKLMNKTLILCPQRLVSWVGPECSPTNLIASTAHILSSGDTVKALATFVDRLRKRSSRAEERSWYPRPTDKGSELHVRQSENASTQKQHSRCHGPHGIAWLCWDDGRKDENGAGSDSGSKAMPMSRHRPLRYRSPQLDKGTRPHSKYLVRDSCVWWPYRLRSTSTAWQIRSPRGGPGSSAAVPEG